ncbi:dermokine [Erethizon dorsatum]
MKLQVSLASLLVALCLGRGAAGPLQGSGTGTGQGMGDTISSGIGNAIGEGAKEAVSSGIQDAIGQGDKGGASSAFREARGDALSNGLGEAAHAFENTGSEPGRQSENIIRHGMDAAHNPTSWGTSGGHGMFDSYGGHGGQGQGNFGGPGSPSGHGNLGGSEGIFGTNSLGGSSGQGSNGGYLNLETNAQGFVAQPGYGSVRGSSQNSGCTNAPPTGSSGSSDNSRESSSHSGGSGSNGGHGGSNGGHSGSSGSHGGSHGGSSGGHGGSSGGHGGSSGGHGGSGSGSSHCDNPGNEARIAGGSGSEGQGSREDSEGSEEVNKLNSVRSFLNSSHFSSIHQDSETSPGVFNFDSFWKNFKSKLGFINWDALNKGQILSPSTRVRLYFRRLWEDFKRRTPFFNWKEITEFSQLDTGRQEVAGVTSKNYYYNQQAYPTVPSGQHLMRSTPKGVTTASSSVSMGTEKTWLKTEEA